jgi:hypothetical protein
VHRASHYCLTEQAGEQVRHYVDKLLEEVDEAQSSALRAAEMDVTRREGSLKAMRAEVRAALFYWVRTRGSPYLFRVLSEFRCVNHGCCLCDVHGLYSTVCRIALTLLSTSCFMMCQVEKERGAQDALLRDMRQMALNAESGQAAGGGAQGSPSGGMAPSYSSANMMNAPASTSKPSAGRVGKR